MKGAVPSFQAHSCSPDGKLSNGAKIDAIYLVFTFRVLRNSCKRCAIIIVLFTMGGVVAMETECLWLLFGVCRTQILPLLYPRVQMLAIRTISKLHAYTLFELEKKVEPALTALS